MTLAATMLLMVPADPLAGVQLSGVQRFLLMLPLCLSIAVVYKTTRCERLRDVPVAALMLWVTIALGMYAVGFGLWAAFAISV
jgi:uncharacterized membrane protein YoaT (DUF817 family)